MAPANRGLRSGLTVQVSNPAERTKRLHLWINGYNMSDGGEIRLDARRSVVSMLDGADSGAEPDASTTMPL